ncbi:MAG: penicillin-binding protein activator [Steroidobacteraceae bacterium]
MQGMAAISSRPRFALAAALSIWLLMPACSLVRPEQPAPPSGAERAQRLVAAGKHAEAAQAYADLATQEPADRDTYELLGAEQWVLANNLDQAKQAFAAVSPAARTTMPASRSLVAAEIALAERDGGGAIRELDTISVPTSPQLAQSYWWLRGKAAFLTGHPVEGTRAFVERERYIADAQALRESREELLALIREAAQRGAPLKPPPKTDQVVAGWLALGPIAAEMTRNPAHAATTLAEWKRAYPQHPGSDMLIAAPPQNAVVIPPASFADQIALLLPLSGRSESVGIAVRDGFIAAYLQQNPATRPPLRIYDVAAESVPGAYRHAVDDGAAFVVGPLTKEDVAAVVPVRAVKTPQLALNFLGDTVNAGHEFYQFALLPEDEARGVARRLLADGKMRGIALIAQGELGTRVQKAFAEEFTQHGGTLVDGGRFDAARADFSDIIKEVLQVHGVKGEPSTHRSDVDFIFLEGPPSAARLVMPQLKFNYAGDVPVYATSDSFEPNPTANSDLDGMFFADMPWMVSTDPSVDQIRDSVRAAWPARTPRLDRLYAFGFDAYRLVPALKSNALSQTQDLVGMTGKLSLDDHDRVRRELEWVQVKSGIPVPL